MKRLVLALDLVDDADLIAEYERWHRPENAWPAITSSLRTSGIHGLEIFRIGDRMVMIIDAGQTYDPIAKSAADAINPDVVAWETMMERYQRRLAGADPNHKWQEMHRIYSLAETTAFKGQPCQA